MALNLWTLAGKLTGYSPLPKEFISIDKLEIGKDFVFTCRAKGAGSFRVSSFGSVNDMHAVQAVTDEYKEYRFEWKETQGGSLYLRDDTVNGTISIKDISVTEKPLGAATINGIDGFASGKWSLHANAKVIDDETLELNATATNQFSEIEYPVLPNTEYTAKVEISDVLGKFDIRYDGSYKFTSRGLLTFKTDSNTKVVKISLARDGVGLVTFKRPQLNLGSTPAPYSKKTGTRMVKPEGPARKNLFNPRLFVNPEFGATYYETAYDAASQLIVTQGVSGILYGKGQHIVVKKNTEYSISCEVVGKDHRIVIFGDVGGNPKFDFTLKVGAARSVKFNSGNDARVYISPLVAEKSGVYGLKNFQIEEGTTATPYEPYAVQQNAKPRKAVQAAPKGLAFDGVRDYLQLPSMTMDEIEMDCNVHVDSTYHMILDARPGLADGYAQFLTGAVDVGSGWASNSGMISGKRTTIKLKAVSAFTNDVKILARYINFANKTRGIVYGIKCYLAGQLVAAYDFTQPGTVVGDKVLPSPVNLIPPFDDKRWSLHANFRVLGRDVGRLDATAGFQQSTALINVKPGAKYISAGIFTGGGAYMELKPFKNGVAGTQIVNMSGVRTIPADCDLVEVSIKNYTNVEPTHFIKPQLYELPATAGTLFGSPRVNDKPARRTLYAKR